MLVDILCAFFYLPIHIPCQNEAETVPRLMSDFGVKSFFLKSSSTILCDICLSKK